MLAHVGITGILKPSKKPQKQRLVAFQKFSPAQVIPVASCDNDSASPQEFHLVAHSTRVIRARSNTHDANTWRAVWRASRTERAVSNDARRSWLTWDEDNAASEPRQEQQVLPAPSTSSLRSNEKIVRFSDGVDVEQYDFAPPEQCDLVSSHELCLKTFVSRVEQASNFSHEFNEAEARDAALQLREDVELQILENEGIGTGQAHNKSEWLAFHASVESVPDESCCLNADSNCQKKPVKKCFWILDVRGMPEHVKHQSEGKRWQDLVRQAVA
eukprot:TRINITY_DN26967_c0_g1_i1.p1 TRINITY_DN26967_c0_g1~~TRINITY_DN26967_c0_g1_i1.p1  ORF type:complete len:272 (-),score=29.97 TRINITY_DN26967_c0_g1_i1:385-1200(-)